MKKLILAMAMLASTQSFAGATVCTGRSACAEPASTLFLVGGPFGTTLSIQAMVDGRLRLVEVAQEIVMAKSTGIISPNLVSLIEEVKTENPLLKDASNETVVRVLELLINVEIK